MLMTIFRKCYPVVGSLAARLPLPAAIGLALAVFAGCGSNGESRIGGVGGLVPDGVDLGGSFVYGAGRYTDISAGQPAGSGINPSAVIDVYGRKLLVATRNEANGNRLSLFRCNLDGSGCNHSDISAGRPSDSSWRNPTALIDESTRSLLVVTTTVDGTLSLFRCELDGTGCAYSDISAGRGKDSASGPSPAIDTLNLKLLVLVSDPSNGDKPALYRCSLDGTSCTYSDISAGQGGASGLSGSLALDMKEKKLLAVTSGYAQQASLFRCDLDGTNCSFRDISAGQGPMSLYYRGKTLLDRNAGKLLHVGQNLSHGGLPWLYRCDLDGTNCASAALSVGGIGGIRCGLSPAAIIDRQLAKLIVVPESLFASFFKCGLDGSHCTFTTHSKCSFGGTCIPQPSPSVDPWYGQLDGPASVVIDETSHRLLVVAEVTSQVDSISGLGLFLFNL